MISLTRPTAPRIEEFLAANIAADFSYSDLGMTRTSSASSKYNIDHNRILLGHGLEAFERGCHAIREWKMFDIRWVEVFPRHAPIISGSVVAVVARAVGLYFLNSCRIVYTIDETRSEVRRFGFAYGTLPDHAEKGEERFLVEWRLDDDSVSYDLLAFSRPSMFFAKVLYPYSRALQKKFARDSLAAMLRAVGCQKQH